MGDRLTERVASRRKAAAEPADVDGADELPAAAQRMVDPGDGAKEDGTEFVGGSIRITAEPGTSYVLPDADPSPPVQVALARVMAEVQYLGKGQLHSSATGGTWRFRGIDDVMNAVGPALRNHGVLVLPELLDATYRDAQTTSGKATREVTVRVAYTFVGPRGDKLRVVVPGESLDNGDKGTAKAMSVAMRIALLQALCLPTDEPDPDATAYQREAANPADEAREHLLAMCREKGYDAKVIAAAFHARYQEPIAFTANAGRVWAFAAELGVNPEGIVGKQPEPDAEPDRAPDPDADPEAAQG